MTYQGASRITIKTYGAHLRHIIRWMQQNGYPEPNLADLTTPLFRRFVFGIGERNLWPGSIRNYLHAL